MVELARVRDGLVDYATTSLIPLLPKQKQFLSGMALGILSENVDNIVEMLASKPVVKALDVIDDQHKINVEQLYRAAKQQLQRGVPLEMDLPYVGTLSLTESDVDALYQRIMR